MSGIIDKKVYLSTFTIRHQCRMGWISFASREEAEENQKECLDPDGIEEHSLEPGYEPGEEWYS